MNANGETTSTLLLNRKQVVGLLTIEECMAGVEQAFKLHAEGNAFPPKILGMHVQDGGFHIKAGILGGERTYFVAKINANFPGNPRLKGLPSIQGVIAVCDVHDGRLLALIDSIEITIIRTGAATAVAAKYLACSGADTATICGCGNQGRISLEALIKVRPLKRVYVYDIDEKKAQRFADEFSTQVKIKAINRDELSTALKQSPIVVTCTPSKEPFIGRDDIAAGSFIAAVGADSEEKRELFPDLLATSKIVVDIAEQSAAIGELHHAIAEKKVTTSSIYAELGMIIAGKKQGRESNNEIIIFDSTGMALQDVAAASIVYEKALEQKVGAAFSFSELSGNHSSFMCSDNEKYSRALRFWFPFR